MTAPLELAKDYIFTHDLRESSGKIYLASIRALLRYFGTEIAAEDIDHRGVLGCRRALLENGLSKQSWNTYSNHLRTVWGYALEQGLLTHTTTNPFRKTAVIPPKRPSKTIARDAIKIARDWLKAMVSEERCSKKRSKVTPAWFWLAAFEMFYYTGIRLNALLTLRYQDIDWLNKLIRVEADTEKTHREFSIPIMAGLEPHIRRLLDAADESGFAPGDQLFNVNRFSRHYRSKVMNIDQVEGMYRKLTTALGVRMTPHRFRHTLATDLMRQPERNIHLTKNLLNHSNIATTLSYIEVDYDHMRAVLHERSLVQGAIAFERRVDEHIPSSPANTLPNPGEQPLPLIPHIPEVPPAPEVIEVVGAMPSLLLPPESPPVPKLLTQVASISSERYSLEQAILPVGTGLSHELTWDGPGTWWEDLGIPQPPSLDEGAESSVLFALMISRVGIKSYSWG
jgi:integrase